MWQGEDDDAGALIAVDDGKGKALEQHPPGIPGSRRPGKREGKRAGSCLLDGGGETSTKPRLLLVVVDDLGKELTARCRHEPG